MSDPLNHTSANWVDSNFLVYRFAANLHAGFGLIYPSAGIQLSTFPLVPALLSWIGPMIGGFPSTGGFVFILAAATGALFLYRLSNGRWVAALVYAVALSLLASPTIAVMLVCSLLGLDLARLGRWRLAGLLIGLAILADPSAFVFAAAILIWAIGDGHWRGYVLAATISVVAGLAPIYLAFGFAIRLISPAPTVILLVIPATLICVIPKISLRLNKNRSLAVLLTSIAILTAIVFIGGDFSLLTIVQYPQSAGLWIAENTGPNATLATTEIGALTFYADRAVIDLSGKLQQIPFDKYFFIRFAPDAVALKDGTPIPWADIATTYDKKVIEGYAIYRRVVNFSPLDDHGVDVKLGQQLGEGLGQISMHLSNVAIGNMLHPGDLVRIRLDWDMAHPPSYPVEIRLNLLNDQGQVVKGITDQIPASEWSAGANSTYHLIVLPGDKVNDKLSLYLGVSVRGGDLLNILKVAEVTRTSV